nr:hypothetical protein [Tanacetum cinerariifolium]
MRDMVGQYIQKKEEENKIEEEQAAKARYWKIPVCYDDDEDYTIAITLKEHDNSLNISKEIYSNPLFDEEIISMKIDLHHFNAESDLIESLVNHDSLIISSSSKIDSLFDEFAGELTLLKSIPPGINETNCDPEEETRFIKRLLYDNSSPHPLEEFISENFDAAFDSFSPFPIPVEDKRGEHAAQISTPSWKCPVFYDDDDDTILETESDEVINSSVENLVPILNESEGISEDTCEVPFCDNSPPLDALNDHLELFFDFNDDCTSSDDDSFEDIDYVEASPPDSELVSLEEMKDDIVKPTRKIR